METLAMVLTKMLGEPIKRAGYQTTRLHGGTLGDVRLVAGTAETAGGMTLPYQVVLKTQKKWERYDDPDSWRREYDLYNSELGLAFDDSLRWPVCYHKEITEDELSLWMEYIHGVTGLNLTGEMYEQAAEEWGRFQGKLYAGGPGLLHSQTNLSKLEYARNFYTHYRSWDVVHDCIRSGQSEIPKHLCQMIIEIDENDEKIFNRIERLPVVFCHRDFWVTNIFYTDGGIRLIDWDTAGWGYLGEDIASLIADEADVPRMVELYKRCVPAYYRGFSKYTDVSYNMEHCIYELILIMYGYRLVEWYLDAETPEIKKLHLDTLQMIYEMRNVVC
jgi:hypothetical protein